MIVQEKIRAVNSNNILVPGNKPCLDIGKPSLHGSQLKELYSSGDECTHKARKPYTITKQRERWTDEEHKKFLEALKLHGRAWRRIEEHIGTKTAVQIRSHAQKFFSKVVRESSSSVKSFEIPPPRPKKKPLHPYPRKLIISSPKGIPVSEPLEMSPSPVASISENENRSPASVLSTVGSDTTGSTTSNQNGCASPVLSAARSNPVGLFIAEQENGYPLSVSSNEEEDRSPSPVTLPTNPGPREKSSMNSEIGCNDLASARDNKSPAPMMTLKLFGRTVLVTDSHRPSSSFVENTSQVHKSQPPINVITDQLNLGSDVQNQAQGSPRNTMQTDLQEVQCKSTWNEFPLAAPPLFYYMQFQQDRNPAGTATPMPWWAIYENFQFPCIHLPIMNLRHATSDSFTEPSGNKDTNKEGSWTDSNSASSKVGVGDKNGDVIDSQSKEKNKELTAIFHLKASENSASSTIGSILQNCSKGFVPYKRCVAERDVQQQKIDNEGREGQRIRLCL